MIIPDSATPGEAVAVLLVVGLMVAWLSACVTAGAVVGWRIGWLR